MTAEYPPGTRLIESRLCERFSVSRTVVREVLRQLEAEGLVRIVPHRGPEVATLTRADAEALYEVREVLERLATELFAVRASDAERAALTTSAAEVAEAIEGGDPRAFLAAKDEFYDTLFSGGKNPEVQKLLETIQARSQLLRVVSLEAPGQGERTVDEITRMTEAAVRGDAAEAGSLAAQHVRAAATAAVSAMEARGLF